MMPQWLSEAEARVAVRRATVLHVHFPRKLPVPPVPLPREALRALAEAGPALRLISNNRAALAPSPKEAA